ncbi:putative dna repair protein rad5 [Diaporthe ampelina]|uniref:Putative dna repair protein rad5 n=1 Tax=Diaporthe ampelina TaxID=1214573 RepID=A0A0G2HA92_9PEZI|nr:putative dna repair protein rad5 [Diaporthe ampelina]
MTTHGMEPHTNGEPPAKKRRFFTNPDENIAHLDASAQNTGQSSKPRFFKDAGATVHADARPYDVSQTDCGIPLAEQESVSVNNASSTAEAGPSNHGGASLAFDQETFESFVGDKVQPDVLEIIRENCGDDIERAVNMYFDGTWKKFKKKAKPMGVQTTVARNSKPQESKPPDDQTNEPLRSTPDFRYIGSFGVEGWATRSGAGLLKYGDSLRIERQKTTQPLKRQRVDVLVRFTNDKGMEIGRLAKDSANWISALMDQKCCKFDATCVYAPERLRTNDTVFIQLRCYFLKSAFHRPGFKLPDNRSTGIYEEKETTEERDLRLRQVALVRLFQEINLNPTKLSAAAARHSRQGLLEAAELAEKQEKEPAKAKKSDKGEKSGSSTPSDDEDGTELEQDQLDSLYKKAQSFDFDTPEAEPAKTFAMTLRPYQKQALHWMLSKEKNEKEKRREVSMHPLWEEYAWPIKDADDKDLPRVADQPCFYMNPYSGDLSLDFPVQEQHCLGGILADEMGLGKTIQMLSLVHSHRSEAAVQARNAHGNGNGSVNNLPRLPASTPGVVSAPCTTLVVAPMSLLAQWQSEAENASKEGTLKSMVYYGSDKVADLRTVCCEANASTAPDVIITSYGVVLSEFTQIAAKGGSMDGHRGLFSLNFFRVIIDEGHNIKNRQSKTAKACYDLSAEHRWVLTGTPIVNKLEDLFSLVRFLRVEPWNNFSFWRTFITVPFEAGNFVKALDVVQTVLEPLVMRRTKDMKTPDGTPLVDLPPKSIEVVDIEMSETERQIYDYVYTRAKRTFQENVQAGTVMKAFTTIFAQLLRLRQTCCHPTLVRNHDIVADEEEAGAAADAAAGLADDMDLSALIERFTADTDDEKDANAFGAHVLKQIRDEAANECPVCCEEPMIEQTVTGCWHSACKKCLLDYINHQTDRHEVPKCFNCREVINSRDLFEVVRHDDDPELKSGQATPRISLQRVGVNASSAKVVSLIKHLRALRRGHPKMKSVVFSQFTSFMTLIEPALEKANMQFLRLDGSMAQKARAAVLDKFRDSNKFTVLLLSLKAGGVGLNLTSAKRVFMMDPWWSFAVEAQAIDRVHRMGQDDEVKVYRFIVKDSVEERMLKVQERKKFIATSLGMMNDEEKKMQRIEDIKELLS